MLTACWTIPIRPLMVFFCSSIFFSFSESRARSRLISLSFFKDESPFSRKRLMMPSFLRSSSLRVEFNSLSAPFFLLREAFLDSSSSTRFCVDFRRASRAFLLTGGVIGVVLILGLGGCGETLCGGLETFAIVDVLDEVDVEVDVVRGSLLGRGVF